MRVLILFQVSAKKDVVVFIFISLISVSLCQTPDMITFISFDYFVASFKCVSQNDLLWSIASDIESSISSLAIADPINVIRFTAMLHLILKKTQHHGTLASSGAATFSLPWLHT